MGDRMHAGAAVLAVVVLLLSTAIGPAAAQEASPPPVPPAPVGEVITLGADAEVLRDDFATPGTWAVGEHETGRLEHLGGALRFTTTRAPDPFWNWWDLALAAPVLWVRLAVDLRDEGGAGGPMCQATSSPALYLGLVNTASEWVIGRTQDGGVTVLARGPLPTSIDLGRGGEAVVAIECAVTGPSGVRIALWVNGINVADLSLPDAVASFAGLGVYGEGYVDGFSVAIDDLVAAVGAAYAPQVRTQAKQPPAPTETSAPATLPPVLTISPAPATAAPAVPASPAAIASPVPSAAAAGDVLSHVPVTFRDACQPTESDPANGLLDAVTCAPAGEAGSALYFLYDSPETVDAAFESLLASRGVVTDGTDCSVGPALIDYTIGGQPAGRLACFNEDSVVAVLWTHRDLRVMGLGIKSDGDFSKMFDWWMEAGPVS
jgi:hypothetical protein